MSSLLISGPAPGLLSTDIVRVYEVADERYTAQKGMRDPRGGL